MMYTVYSYYSDKFGGSLIPKEEWRRAAGLASDYLDAATFGRLSDGVPEEFAEQVKRCCCALAEAIYSFQLGNGDASGNSGKPKTQETIGAYSVSYASTGSTISALLNGAEAGLQDYLHSICMRYLGRTGLLYRGVC